MCEAGCVDCGHSLRENSGFLLSVTCAQAKAARGHLREMSIKSSTKTNKANLNTEALTFGEESHDRPQVHSITGLET